MPAVVALNKIDLVDGPRLGARLEEARALSGGAEVLPVSALRGDGLADVLARLSAAMPPGPVYFPEGQQSDQPLELLVAELVREQALRLTRDEVPHAVAVEVGSITERGDRPLVEIEASLIVETESQKAIVVGKGGRVVKAIGSGARHEIEAILGRAGVPRPARQGAQALAPRRPLHRAPSLGQPRLLYSPGSD